MILCEVEAAADQARAHSSEISSCLRVAATSLVAVNLVAPCVADSQQQHPEVQVEINTAERPMQELHESDLSTWDQDDHLDADVVVRPVLDMNCLRCAPTSYLQGHGVPATPQDLSRHRPARLRTPGMRLHGISLVNHEQRVGVVEVASAWSVISNDDETAYQATLAGVVITLLPELALIAHIHGGRLRRVLAPWVSAEGVRPVATMPRRRFLPLRARAFLELLVQHVRQVAATAVTEQPLPSTAR